MVVIKITFGHRNLLKNTVRKTHSQDVSKLVHANIFQENKTAFLESSTKNVPGRRNKNVLNVYYNNFCIFSVFMVLAKRIKYT